MVLDEVRLAHVSNIRHSAEHTEKIPQHPFLTYKLDKDKTLMQNFNKKQTDTQNENQFEIQTKIKIKIKNSISIKNHTPLYCSQKTMK